MRYTVVCVFILISLPALAQEKTSNPEFLSLKSYYGFIIPHTSSIRHLTDSKPYGVEMDYGWVLTKQRDWERCNCYARAGFSLSHIDFDHPEVLGTATNVMMFAEPYLNYGSNIWMSIRMGVGPSYVSKVYDQKTNPENLFFSKHLSYIIHLDFMLNFLLSEHLNGKLFGKYNHISNGGVDHPNKGMNFPTVGVGLDYVLESPDFKQRESVPIKQEGIIISGAVFGAMKNVTQGPSEIKQRTLGYGFLVKGRRKIAKINALNTGFEGFWDGEIKEKYNGQREHRQLSWLAGHDFIFGRFIFSQYWGTYLYAPAYNKHFFQRYSLSYNFFGNLRAGVNLKAHAEVAQNFNVHIAYDLTSIVSKK